MMYNSMLMSPLHKRREMEDEQDIALETSQLMIRSPSSYKRPRYEPSWTVNTLCTHPYSPLASIDLESIFNYSTFQLLSREKKEELCSLLPSVDQPCLSEDGSIEPSFFIKSENPYFWDSLTEWQSMVSLGDFMHPESSSPPSHKSTCIHKTKSKSKYIKKEKIKDEIHESHVGESSIDKEKANNVAGESKSITLKDMCRKGLIRENDIIVYKRNFSACKVVVNKSMTVVKACGVSGISIQLDDETFEDFETPTALETKILDHHGKVTKDKRPNGNAFKSIRLLRAGKDMGRLFDIRKDGFGDP